jgi:hypothetical protein
MSDDSEQLQKKVEALEREVAALKCGLGRRGVRKRSANSLWGLPWYDIALGPDTDKNEVRGHARGIIAIGDIATGIFAVGGVARGFFAFGGLAWGAITFGGCSIGLLVAIGGLAVGLLALGGAAIGMVAVGGGAFGYYACGGGAFGKYVISGMQQDPEAIRFFGQWIPGLDQLVPPPKR